MKKTTEANSLKWLLITTTLALVLIIGEMISSYLISNPSKANGMGVSFANFLALSSLVCLVLFIVASIKVKGYSKIVELFYCLIALIILGLALFAASFSQLGSY